MSADASADLLKAVRAALIADATVSGYVGSRVSSDWAADLETPFLRLSVPIVKEWEDDCGEGGEHDVRVSVFSRGGPVERSQIAAAIRDALRNNDTISLDNSVMRQIRWVQTINLQEPDDPTMFSAVVRFEAITTSTT